MAVDRPTPLRDRVVAKLREAIVTGRFTPGARLVERQMCELLGVSRTLVREALRQLEAEGWVRILPNRGPVVATITPEEVKELYQVRGALEGLAAQLCAERATPADLAALEQAVVKLRLAQRAGDLDTQREQAGVFYEKLREVAGNVVLRTHLAALSTRLAWLRTMAFSQPARASANVKEEELLLDALKKRDGPRARALCEAHINAAALSLTKTLNEATQRQNRNQHRSRTAELL